MEEQEQKRSHRSYHDSTEGVRKRDRSHDRDRRQSGEGGEEREHRHRHHRSSRSSRSEETGGKTRDKRRGRDRRRDRDGDCDDESRKRSRKDHDGREDYGEGSSRRHRRSRRDDYKSPEDASAKEVAEALDDAEGQWVEKPVLQPEDPLPETTKAIKSTTKRQSWMIQSEQDAFDFTQRGAKKPTQAVHSGSTRPDYAPLIHRNELNMQMKEGKSVDEYTKEDTPSYVFGDSGSNWRMMKLRRVHETAEETGQDVDTVALERYGDFRAFDEAREERQELDRRQMYGTDRPDSKDRPTGDLHAERLKQNNPPHPHRDRLPPSPRQGQVIDDGPHTTTTQLLDQSTLNRMQAALLKAQLRGDPGATDMEKEYNAALAQFANQKEPEVVVLSAMDSRMLAHTIGGRGEVKEVTTGRKRGKLEDNDDMTIEDMLREEKRTRGQFNGGEGKMFADRIAKDGKFTDNLDYMDENAERLAKRIHKGEIDMKNMAVNEFKKMQKVLDSCPLCQHEDRNAPPIAPVISTGTRVFLTLPTDPELSTCGAVIVPIQHRVNMLECDDDEWEEVRNFMKSLIRMYHDQGRGVVFYENAATPGRKRHATIEAVPLPLDLSETAPAYFKEAIMSSDEEWSQHKKIIDTLSRARKDGLGKQAFRRSLVKEMPYFHVWFEIDGGMGHIVENADRWPRGDLFAREVLGGMLDLEPNIIKKQGRWMKGKDRREDDFKRKWYKFDWTRVLLDGQ